MLYPQSRRTRGSAPSLTFETPLDELSADAMRDLWRDYKRRRSDALRTRLIVHYMQGHVRRIAARLHKSLPSQVDLEDLVQQGYLGLIDAMERYDVEREITFETFSSLRIAGAMHDYLRRIDHLPRMARKRLKLVQYAEDDFRKRHGRAPSEEELRTRASTSPPEFQRFLAERSPAAPMSLHSRSSQDDAPAEPGGFANIIDERQRTPLVHVQRENMREWVSRGLDQRDRLILQLYYYEELTMREVGMALGISESRVSQRLELIHERIRSRLSLREAERELVMQ